ncbi:futalosine hydrolase [Streptomyces sp. AK02-01A]|uniref:futalosine hydrolase n=1 Tax=Streptomyces sp. AK02-01A TaxID=3028648 RepID=UPI0029B20979|nr:futalosine hydrolase [Streptomyces sp. AK02-01A]MDX3853835.1 futalosine hydrolase [Streptomyces sp. AK02-01A]
MRVLVVTAVVAEADSVVAGLARFAGLGVREMTGGYEIRGHAQYAPRPSSVQIPVVDVLAGGIGPTAAAVATATALASSPYDPPYDLVISAGVGGGFPPHAPLGSLVVADAIIAAELGADTPDGYVPIEKLGFGRSVHRPPAELTGRMAKILNADPVTSAVLAPVLTVSTVTGTAAGAARLTARHPRAAAEAMEGFGVAEAAAVHSVPCAEIRAISNAVGPRNRADWRIGQALDSLRSAFTLLTPVFEEPS